MAELQQRLTRALAEARENGVPDAMIKKILESELPSLPKYRKTKCTAGRVGYAALFYMLPLLTLLAVIGYGAWNYYQDYPCYYFVPEPLLEIMGPLADCDFCKGVEHAPRLSNLSRVEFIHKYGFSGQPIIVTDATSTWKASSVFSYKFFKQLYLSRPESLDNDTQFGQFFQYSTSIRNLHELFNMSEDNVKFKGERWYIGWSTGDDVIRHELEKYFSEPYFVPKQVNEFGEEGEEESKFFAWIFMGAPGPGASLHIDHVGSPSWQAQLVGKKTWTLTPPPECFDVCTSFNATINTGEMFVVDTNRWFHATYIHPGSISITIGSEYD